MVKLKSICSTIEYDLPIALTAEQASEMPEYSDGNPLSQVDEDCSRLATPGDAPSVQKKALKIALVDSGAPDDAHVVSKKSVLDGDAADTSGHASEVLSEIVKWSPTADIVSVKVLDDTGHGSTASLYAALKSLSGSDADIVNLSVASPASGDSDLIDSAIEELTSQGKAVIVAAGNGGSDVSRYVPANSPSAITVGSCDADGVVSEFSNRGDELDVLAVSESTSCATAMVSGFASANATSAEDVAAVVADEMAKGTTGRFFAPDASVNAVPSGTESDAQGYDDNDIGTLSGAAGVRKLTEIRPDRDRTDSALPGQGIIFDNGGYCFNMKTAVFTSAGNSTAAMGTHKFKGENQYAVWIPNLETTKKGKWSYSVPGSFTLKFPNVGCDSSGDRIDLSLTVSGITVKHARDKSQPSGGSKYIRIVFADTDGALWLSSRMQDDKKGKTQKSGVKYNVSANITKTGTNTPATGHLLAAFLDIDQPDSSTSTATYSGDYVESVTMGSGFEGTSYTEIGKQSELNFDSGKNRYYAKRVDDNEQLMETAFIGRTTSSFNLSWSGSNCATQIMSMYDGVNVYDKNLDVQEGGKIRVSLTPNGVPVDINSAAWRTAGTDRTIKTAWKAEGALQPTYYFSANTGYKVLGVQMGPDDAHLVSIGAPESYQFTTGQLSRNRVIRLLTQRVPDKHVQITARKQLDGKVLQQGDFAFELIDVDSGQVVSRTTNEDDGSVSFDLTYTYPEGVGEHHYKIVEDQGNDYHVAYDDSKYTASVTVTERDGEMSAVIDYDDDDRTFVNTFSNYGGLVVSKVDSDSDAAIPGAVFTVFEYDPSAPDHKGQKVLSGKTSITSGLWETGDRALKANGNKYIVEETKAPAGYYLVDPDDSSASPWSREFTLTTDGEIADFSDSPVPNKRKPATASLGIKKILTGRTLESGEFRFALKDENGNTLQEIVNGPDGYAYFDEITYPPGTEGNTYHYTIEEVAGDAPGISYDPTVYDVTVTIENADGTLVAQTDYVQRDSSTTASPLSFIGSLAGTFMQTVSSFMMPSSSALDTSEISERPSIAILDTGVSDDRAVANRESVLGDDGDDSVGHGNLMYDIIKQKAPDADISSIKVMSDGQGSIDDLVRGIDRAVALKSDFILVAMYAYLPEGDRDLDAAISMANASGAKVIVAAGNAGCDATQYVPASCAGALTIGACDGNDTVLPSSNFGEPVDVYIAANSTSEAAALAVAELALGGVSSGRQAVRAEDTVIASHLENVPGVLVPATDLWSSATDANTNDVGTVKMRAYVSYTYTETATTWSVTAKLYTALANTSLGKCDVGGAVLGQSYDIKSKNKDSTKKYNGVSYALFYVGSGSASGSKTTSTQTKTWTPTAKYKGKSTSSINATLKITVSALDSYIVSYNANGESASVPGNQKKWYGSAVTLSSMVPEGQGSHYVTTFEYNIPGKQQTTYESDASVEFVNWNTSADGSGTTYSPGQSYTANAKATLYAQWTKNDPRATTLPLAERPGYVCGGWYSDAAFTTKVGDPGASYQPTKTETLYMMWTPITYRVEYDGNGVSGEIPGQDAIYDEYLDLAENGYGSVPGQKFIGWSTSQFLAAEGEAEYREGQSVANLTTIASSTVTLYAVWVPNIAIFSNTYTPRYDIQLVKVDANDSNKTLEGAQFTITCSGEPDIIIETGADGIAKTTGKALSANKTYTITETKAPEGYCLPRTILTSRRTVFLPSQAVDGLDGPEPVYELGLWKNTPKSATLAIEGSKYYFEQMGRNQFDRSFLSRDFVFDLYDENWNLIDSTTINDDDLIDTGEYHFNFTPILYTYEDVGKTFVYHVKERDLGYPHVSSSTLEATVKGIVTDSIYNINAAVDWTESGPIDDAWGNLGPFNNTYVPGYDVKIKKYELASDEVNPDENAEGSEADDEANSSLSDAEFTIFRWDSYESDYAYPFWHLEVPNVFADEDLFAQTFSLNDRAQELSYDAQKLMNSFGLTPVATVKSDSNGAKTSDLALECGHIYIILETKAPLGYKLAETPYIYILPDYNESEQYPHAIYLNEEDDVSYAVLDGQGYMYPEYQTLDDLALTKGYKVIVGQGGSEEEPTDIEFWNEENDTPSAGIKLMKLSDEGEPIANTEFAVYDDAEFVQAYYDWLNEQNEPISDAEFLNWLDDSESAPEQLAYIETDEEGIASTSCKALPVNNCYRIIEVASARGFSTDEYDFQNPDSETTGNEIIFIPEDAENTFVELKFPFKNAKVEYNGSVEIDVHKTFITKGTEDRPLGDGEFEFVLTKLDEDGHTIPETEQRAHNDLSGNVKFSLSYTDEDEGTHKYEIREVNAGDPLIEYDEHVSYATVSVEMDDDKLNCSLTRLTDPEFVNTDNIVSPSGYAGVKLKKTDESGSPLGGAVFTGYHAGIYNGIDKDDPAQLEDATAFIITTSDIDDASKGLELGIAKLGKVLRPGTFIVKETKSPDGYALSDSWSATFTVDDSNIDTIIDLTGSPCVDVPGYPVHYMWKAEGDAGYREVSKVDAAPRGDYETLTYSSAGIEATDGCTLAGWGKTSVESAPASLDAVSPGSTTNLAGETWLWASETRNTYPVHYMWKPYGGTYSEICSDGPISHGPYTVLTQDEAGISASTGCTTTSWGISESDATIPEDLSSINGGDEIQLTGETWLWATENINKYPVHYMWKAGGTDSFREIRTVPAVDHGSYTTLAASAAGASETVGYTAQAWGKTTSDEAPASFNAVSPTSATSVEGETWFWGQEVLNTYPVHYMWKAIGADHYEAVKDIPAVAHGTYTTLGLAAAGITPTAGCTASGWGKTILLAEPDSLDAVAPGSATAITGETWLWASETRNTYPVHYMWKAEGANDYANKKNETVEHGEYPTLSLAGAGIDVTEGCSPAAWGKTEEEMAPADFTAVSPGSSTQITGETWLWGNETRNTYPVHYMWKAEGADGYELIDTVDDVPYGDYSTLSLEGAGITATTGCSPAAYGKTTTSDAPSELHAVSPGSSTKVTSETWLWASETRNTYPVHYMWKADGARDWDEVKTINKVLYGTYATLSLMDAGITATDGCTTAAYGKTTDETVPGVFSEVSPGTETQVTGETWLWATESRNTYPVHYMWKSATDTDYSLVKTNERVPHGTYATLSLIDAGITVTDGCTAAAYGKTAENAAPSSFEDAAPGTETQIVGETWLWATEIVDKVPGLSLTKKVVEKGTSTSDAQSEIRLYNPVAGDEVVWVFEIKNTGNVPIHDIWVKDVMLGSSGRDAVSALKFDGTLEPGATARLTRDYALSSRDITAKESENTAQAIGTSEDSGSAGDVSSDESTARVDMADTSIAIEKTVATPKLVNPSAGDEVEWRFKITNTGDIPLSDIWVRDDLVGSIARTSGKVTLSKTSLAAGESTTGTARYTLTSADIATSKVNNTATACGSGDGGDVESAPDSADVAIVITKLAVVKTVDKPRLVNPSVGDEVEWRFTVTNEGNVDVSDLWIRDELLGATSSTSAKVVLDKTTLASGESASGTAKYALTESDIATGKVDNTAVAVGTSDGAGIESPPDDASVAIVRNKLAIEKTVDKPRLINPSVGDEVEWRFTVTNEGNVDVSDLWIRDELLGAISTASAKVSLDKTTLSPGESASGTAKYALTESDIATGKVDNAATAVGTGSGETVESDPDEASVSIGSAKLSIEKTSDKQVLVNPSAGDEVEWRFKVVNEGNVSVDGIWIRDELIGATDSVSARVPLSKTTLAPGEQTTGTARYALTAADIATGKVDNVAVANGTTDGNEITSDPDDATVTIGTGKLAIEKTVDKTELINPSPGDEVEWRFTVSNIGDVPVSNLWIYDEMLGSTSSFSGKIPLDKTALEPGQSTTGTANYALTESDIAAGKIVNTATARGTSDTSSIESLPDDAQVTIKSAKLALVKSADKIKLINPSAGDVVEWSVAVTNMGDAEISGVWVYDELLGATTPASAKFSLDKTTLAPGEIATGKAVYALTEADIAAGKVDNTAVAKGDVKGTSVESGPGTASVRLTSAKLVVDKTADKTELINPSPGDEVTWKFKVINNSETTISDIWVLDEMLGQTGAGSGKVTLDKTVLAPGESATASVKYALTAADIAAGRVCNTAIAKGTAEDGKDISSDEDAAEIVMLMPKLEVEKSSDKKQLVNPQTGNEIEWRFLVRNTGTAEISGIWIYDEALGATSADARKVSLGKTTLAPGETTTGTAKYALSEEDLSKTAIDNIALAKGQDGNGKEIESEPAAASIPVIRASLLLEKSADRTVFANAIEGDEIEWRFDVLNPESSTVSIDDLWLYDEMLGATGPRDKVISLDRDSLAPGEHAVATARYKLTAADIERGSVENRAVARGGASGTEVESAPSAAVVSIGCGSLLLEKRADRDALSSAVPGDKIEWQFKVTNTGSSAVDEVWIYDELLGSLDNSSSKIALDKTTLEPGESATGTALYAITATDIAMGEVSNTATANGRSEEGTELVSEPDSAKVSLTPPAPRPSVVEMVATGDNGTVLLSIAGLTATCAAIGAVIKIRRRKSR